VKIRVAVPISGRADRGLSEPIIKRLSESSCFKVIIWETDDIHKGKLVDCLLLGNLHIKEDKPDIVLIVGDRIEMLGYAQAAFHNNIPIAHVYAGITGDAGTFDMVNRHVISLWSTYQFCDTIDATTHVTRLKLGAGQKAKAWTVGCTHMDDARVDESMVPDNTYILVAYNPLTVENARELIKNDIDEITEHCFSCYDIDKIIWVGPNNDPNNEYVRKLIAEKVSRYNQKCNNHITFYANDLDRAKFIGLVKNCKKFIGNSSCMYYEAPYFLQPSQIISIGIRNKNRTFVTEYNASRLIVNILERELCE